MKFRDRAFIDIAISSTQLQTPPVTTKTLFNTIIYLTHLRSSIYYIYNSKRHLIQYPPPEQSPRMSHPTSTPHETYASTPPPPPPKPSVHEPPLAGRSPVPLPPRDSSYTPWHTQSRPEARPTENIRAWDHGDGVPEAGSPQQYRHPYAQQSEQQIQQPALPEEGWVPDMLKDMSYV